MPTTNTNFTTLITAIDTKAQELASSTTDPKDLVFLGKAVEALNVADTVSDIITEGDDQVAAVNSAGAAQVSAVTTEGATQLSAVTAEGATQLAAVQAEGASYATQANVDALIAEITVTVANGNFVIDGTEQESLSLTPSVTYRFDTSDASNAGHPLKFSTTADGTHASPAGTEFTTGVTTVGTAGSANSYVQIIVEQDSPTLYYYCANHSGMGSTAYSAYNVLSTAPTEGQVLTYDAVTAAYVNRAATGGANPTLTSIDQVYFLNPTNWRYHQTYASPLVRRGGYTGNTFGSISLAGNSSASNTAVYGHAVTVNPATGALTTTDSNRQLWLNSSGVGMSTTWFWHPYGTGGIYYGGNNAWPGYSSHTFGYGTAYLNNGGTWNQITATYDGHGHGGNGAYYSIPTSDTTGRFISIGYHQSDSRVRWRNNTFNDTSFNIGSEQNPNSNTSTVYGMNFIGNKDATITANTPVSGMQYRDNSSNYKMLLTSRDGSTQIYDIGEWSSSSYAFLLTNGIVVIWSNSGSNFAGNTYSGLSSTSTRWPLSFGNYSSPVHVENNKFMRTVNQGNGGEGLILFEIDPTTYEVTMLEQVDLGISDYELTQSYTDFSVVYDSNGSPAYIMGFRRSGTFHHFKTFEWPFS